MRRVLLVDLSNVAWRAVCSHAMLSHRGENTGGAYGFLQMICKIVNTHDINRIIVCDDAKPYHREKVFPTYKSGRGTVHVNTDKVDMRGPVQKGKAQIAELLDFFGQHVMRVKGYEADDLIARATLNLTSQPARSCRVFIASNDSDLYSLLSKERKVAMCKKDGLYTFNDFMAEYEIWPVKWPRVLALCGSHNGVPGIPGVGVKTAVKLVSESASDRYLARTYHLDVETLSLREKLSTYPWEDGLQEVKFRCVPLMYERRRTIAWMHMRFGIDFAPYMQSAFELLATP
jgi:5'-3' exonuclease